MINKIINYLGIEEEFLNEEISKVIISESIKMEEKYKSELENNIYQYALHDDVFRCYDKEKEIVDVIEKLDYITVFEIRTV